MVNRAFTSILVLAMVSLLTTISAAAQTGYWVSVDDQSGLERSVVYVYQTSGGYYAAKIVKLIDKSNGENPICVKCPGDQKNQPVLGLIIMWGLTKDANSGKLTGGTILDPETGNDYGCKIWLEGENLKVRGIHWTGIYRTQTWYPTSKP